uniref:glucosamine inositolphosphorylceramide transferase family protein n=1 Tax=Stappia sp. TaxID=1870903 RepID=UPI003BAC1791
MGTGATLETAPAGQGAAAEASGALTVVTGADARFARTLYRFLASLERHRGDAVARVLVVDLGLAPGDRERIARRFPFAAIVPFPFHAHPPHVAVSSGTFAWKPLAILEAARRFGGKVFWFDSATLLHAGLDEPLSTLGRTGLYTLKGQSNLAQRCEPRVLGHLGVEPAFLDRQIRLGGLVGFDWDHPGAREVLEDWARLALDGEAFRPASTTHNADQSVLTVLLLRAEAAGKVELGDEDVDISSPRPIRWASTRNKIDARRPTWTDPLQGLWYRAYKAGDRINLRWQDFYRRRLLGLHRFPKEHFQVFLMRTGMSEPVAVPAPTFSYYADPFLRRVEGRLWLFVEEFEYLEQRGRLVVIELGEDLRPCGPAVPVLPIREHASFPYVFAADGALLMLPETCAMGALDLYVCERFPDRWYRVRRLEHDVDAVDALAWPDGQGWRLVSCERAGGSEGARTLAVYHMAGLPGGDPKPDPVNGTGVFADGRHGYGRGAGDPLAEADGTVLRPMQANRAYYGEAVEIRRTGEDAGGAHVEEAVGDDHPLARFARLTSPHHISLSGDVVAFDLRTRLGFVSGVPWLGRRLNALNPAAKRFLARDPRVLAELERILPEVTRRLRPLHGC